MNARKVLIAVQLLMIVALLLSACGGAAAPTGAPAAPVAPDSGLAAMPAAPAAPAEAAASGSAGKGSGEIQSGTLTAGDFDDNLNFAAFQHYLTTMLQNNSSQVLPAMSLTDRVTLRITDAQGRGVANARVSVSISDGAAPLLDASAGADGVFRFLPNFDGANESAQFTARIRPADVDGPETTVSFNLSNLDDSRTVEVRLDGVSAALPRALDVMLVMDATGSMGDEIRYLTTEFRAIVATIQSQFPGVSTRFGLVVYRDLGDEFVVRKFDFTDSVDTMQSQLAQQNASGGGDYPEAMEQALAAAIDTSWRGGNTARLLFLIADAPPHDQNLRAAIEQGRTARRLGLHIYPLAASGVADTAEYLMRVIAATTHGRYLFLTDDSGVGNAHAEPRVPCYVVTRLDQLLIRVITGELSGQRVEAAPDQIIRSVGQQDGGVCASK